MAYNSQDRCERPITDGVITTYLHLLQFVGRGLAHLLEDAGEIRSRTACYKRTFCWLSNCSEECLELVRIRKIEE